MKMTDHLKFLRGICLAFFASLLVACGGGTDTLFGEAEDDGTTGNPTTVESDSTIVTSISLLTETAQIPSDGSTGTLLIAIVKDANNNFVSGASVTFSVDSGGVQVINGTTGPTGRATAELNAAGDSRNRTITAEVVELSSLQSDSTLVQVTGTQLIISGPDAIVQGSTVNFVAALRDSSGSGIPNELITISSEQGNTVSTPSLRTDINGEVAISYTADVTGSDQLLVTALEITTGQPIAVSNDTFAFTAPVGSGSSETAEVDIDTTTNVTLRWETNGIAVSNRQVSFSTTRGTLSASSGQTDGNGDITVSIQSNNAGPAVVTATGMNGPSAQLRLEFVAVVADSLELQASPVSIATQEKSTITAIVRDPNGNLVKGQTVTFESEDTTGGQLSNGSAVTDSLGRAQTVYTASGATSGQGSVLITATVNGVPAATGQVALTVSQKALFVTIAQGDIVVVDSTQYSIPFSVQVADSNGNPVEGVDVELSSVPPVNGIAYAKGCRVVTADNLTDEEEPQPLPTIQCGGSTSSNFAAKTGKWSLYVTDYCLSEDIDQDGVLDAGEDFNGNGSLEPGIRALTEPGTVTTNTSGQGAFSLTFGKDYGNWLAVIVTATARVEGTESAHESRFALPVAAVDVATEDAAPGTVSPFGVGTCDEPQ